MTHYPLFSFWAELYSRNTKEYIHAWKKFNDAVSGYLYDFRDFTISASRMFFRQIENPEELYRIYSCNLRHQKKLILLYQNFLFNTYANQTEEKTGDKKKDKRFISSPWQSSSIHKFLFHQHNLAEEYFYELIHSSPLKEKDQRKIYFYIKFILDAAAPSNFLWSNPEALKLAIETGGISLIDGFSNWLYDARRGDITQTDEDAFQVGINLAASEGKIVYQNELIQLIQYSTPTEKVYAVPLLIIPPWINKYYILDLQKSNSFVGFLSGNGHQVFLISWKNPDHALTEITFDEYVSKGTLPAIEVAKKISGSEKLNTIGYCLGGTLLGITSAILAAQREESPINSIGLLAAMLDFSDIGPMSAVVSKALVKKIERGELLINNGLVHGRYMEMGFNLIRANDLIWYYVVNNYLEGKKPKAFDVLYWTNDNTNLPAGMYKYYMKRMILENRLSKKDELMINGTAIDLGKIKSPAIVIGFCEDHISPAHTVFTTLKLFSSVVEFVLGMSGHVMGVVNPPEKGKYGYYKQGKSTENLNAWRESAEFKNESWWMEYIRFINEKSGKQIAGKKKFGNDEYPPLQNAPGTYVLEKCGDLGMFYF